MRVTIAGPEERFPRKVIGFAHRGAPLSSKEENTLPAFRRALDLGATGLESDVGLTVDGVPVLLHLGLSLRARSISRVRRGNLHARIPSLADLYAECGHEFDLALDMAEPRAAESVVRTAEEYGALDRLWLTYWRVTTLEAWRRRWPDVHLVYPALPLRPGSAGRLVDQLRAARVDVLNVHHRICTRGLSAYVRHHGLGIFAWGVRNRGALERVLAHGVDGVFCDDVESMVELTAGHLQRVQ